MALERRGRIWHYDFQLGGERYRGTTGQTSKAAAREVEQRERDRIRSVGRDDRQVTLRLAASTWYRATQEHLRSARTTAYRLETLKRCMDFDTDVRLISTRVVADAIAVRRGHKTHNARAPTPSTVNRDVIDTLRPVLNYARKVMEVRGMPEVDWKAVRLREPKGRVREFTAAEYETIRAHLAHLPHHLDLFDFLSLFGVRLREAWFPLDCLDVEGRRIFLRQRKGGDWHTIPLDETWARKLATRAGRARAARLNTVWFWEDGAGDLHALSPRSFQSYMANLLDALKISDARPAHDLRHHAGTQYVRRTGNLKGAQRLLGHENIATTARYAHASEDDVRAGLFGAAPQNSPQSPEEVVQSLENKERPTGT